MGVIALIMAHLTNVSFFPLHIYSFDLLLSPVTEFHSLVMSWIKEQFLFICFISAVSSKYPLNPWRFGLHFKVPNTSRSLSLFLHLQYNTFFFLDIIVKGK